MHWHKIEYLITCGLRPWYFDHTDTCQPSALPAATLAATMSPEAPHVLAQQQQLQQQLQQQQHNQFQPPAGQQQPWVYPGSYTGPNQATWPQLWQCQPGGGTACGGDVHAVVRAGQPWQSSPGSWQCDVNITLINKGNICRLCCGSDSLAGSLPV